ncbi:alpha/beta-hydrolase [Cubamyces sp. BRFM 1775]|nr:alpha/beta-hydrolase [Cubamyces sp. BRFM 1775]
MRSYEQRALFFVIVAGAAALYFAELSPPTAAETMTWSTKLISRLGLWGACLSILGLASASPPNVVDVGYAKYQGNLSYPNTVAYLGIPYAEPPVGERRFRSPLPLDTARVARETQGKVVAANVYPDFCVQGSTGSGDAGGAGSEDCLKVNIYAPAGAKAGDKLPVLVYIHGGGYVYGNPANWPFDHWIHQSPNVVVVSVYYRLDSFGFLSVPELADGTLGDLNAGFLDQIQALKWVQQHIHSFGGDPTKVTINGESAGGSSVELHLVAHEGEKLFSQAIAQSVYRAPLPSPEQQRPLFDYYSEQAGCGSSSDSVASRMACLRKASISALARAQDAAMYNFTGAYNGFHPVLDGKLFTEIPTLSILKGNFADVPVIVGSTSNETLSGGSNITSALKTFFPGLTSQDLEEYLEHYPSSEFDSDSQRFTVATGESELICARAIIGTSAARKSKAYTYRYNQPVPTANTTVVFHASENWMMFRGTSTGFNGSTTFQPQRPIDEAFASELIAYWLSFVRSGDPSTHKLARSPVWPAYTLKNKARIALQEPESASTEVSGSTIETEPEAESSRCAFVASKVRHQQA